MPKTDRTIEKFVILPESVLDSGVSSKALHVYAAIRRHADNTTGTTYVGRERLAEYLGSKRAATVDPYIKELVDAGVITSQVRWCSKRDKRDWVLEKDADHTVQGSNLYTIIDIAAAQTGYVFSDPGGTQKRTRGVRKSGHELDPFNQTPLTTDEKRSVGAAARAAHPMPEDWEPNKFHASTATRIGVDVHHVAAEFRDKMQGQRRKDWGKAFGAYLNAYSDGREDEVFHDASEGKRMTWDWDMCEALADVHGIDPESVPAEVMGKAGEVFEAGHTAEDFAAAIARHRDNHPDVYARTSVLAEDPFGGDVAPVEAEVIEQSTVTDMSTARPGPGAAGYSPEIEEVIRRVEGMTAGHLTGEERVMVATQAQQGLRFNVIAGNIENERDNAALRAEVS